MKSLRFVLAVVLMSLSTVVFAQSDAQKPVAQSDAQKMDAPKAAAPKSDAQMSFDTMKTLAGSWEGPVTTSPQAVEVEGKPAQILLRVTSRGNALMHDLTIAGIPDNPITMFYLDSDRMLLTHYCDAGNRPRMTGKMSPDGKKVEFEFLDIAGNPQYHMHHAVFTIIDANHHTEDWTFMMKDKPIHAHFDLQRIKGGSAGAGQ
ncbi:MAG: hypothetical protein ACHP7I_03630 [Terriglobales bacterium]